MALPADLWWRPGNYSLLLIYRPRKDERLSWPSWLTYSGRFSHMVTRQLYIERSTEKVRRSKTDVLPPRHATNQVKYNRNLSTARVQVQAWSTTSLQRAAWPQWRGPLQRRPEIQGLKSKQRRGVLGGEQALFPKARVWRAESGQRVSLHVRCLLGWTVQSAITDDSNTHGNHLYELWLRMR